MGEDPRSGIAQSSGGAYTSGKPDGDTQSTGEVAEDSNPAAAPVAAADEPTQPASGAPGDPDATVRDEVAQPTVLQPTVAAKGSNATPGKPASSWTIPTGVSRTGANARSAALRPPPAQAAGGPAGDPPDLQTVQQPAATTVSGSSATQVRSVVSQATPGAATAQMTAPTMTGAASSVVAEALAWAGLSPSLTDSPAAPVESPAMLALLAGWRRQSQQALAGETPTDVANLPQTSQTVDPMVTGDLDATRGDRQAVAGISTMQLSAPVNVAVTDTMPPTVVLIAPPAGPVSGTVTLAATAADDVGVAGVQFLVNNVALGVEDTSSPYSLVVNTTGAPSGTYTLTARARDAAGNTTISAPVNITIADTMPPAVVLIAPPAGPVSGTVTLAATAADDVGVVGVQFLVNNVALGVEDTSSPYSLLVNTTGAPNGTYTLTARARDAAGNTTISAPVNVTIANGPTLIPSAEQLWSNLVAIGTGDGLAAQLVLSADGTTKRMIVYMTGASDGSSEAWSDAQQGNGGWLNPKVSAFIDNAYNISKPAEIMLVGFSAGGQQMQNYAATGTNRNLVKVVVLYGAPLTKTTAELTADSLLIASSGDDVYAAFTHRDAVDSYNVSSSDKFAVYVVASGPHIGATYEYAANNFDNSVRHDDPSSQYVRINNDMQRF